MRMAELGLVHRHEMSGVLHGLMRVRAFTQDDAHIYCLPEQIEQEVLGVIDLTLRMYRTFGFEKVHMELSTRPAKSIGTDEMWQNGRVGAGGRSRAQRTRVQPQPGRRRLLRPEDRLPHRRCDGAHVAVRNLPAGLRHARALRPGVRGRGQPAAPTGHAAPHRPGEHRALPGHPDRALRRGFPGLACSGAGRPDPGRRPAYRLRRPGWRPNSRRREYGSRSTNEPSRWAARSGTTNCARCRAC